MSDTTVEQAIPDADVEEADTADTTPRHVKTRVDWVIDGAVAFICIGVATAWTFNPLHRQFTGGTFSNYFEGQARAFLDGHLAIDPGVLGIEAFIRDGNEYMYFGPLLGIFRLPQVLLTYSLDGRTTAISLLIGTLVLYWQSIKLLDRVLDLVHPDVEESPTERWFRLGWRASVAAGTVVLTLLAIPWGYHEAHLWSAALFIALLTQILRFNDMTPRRIWIFGLVLLALVLNRPTTAYAGLIGVALLIVVVFVRKSVSRGNLTRLSVCFGVALFATVSVNYAKFRRPFGIPMEDQFFTKVDENRAQMLLVNDGKYFQTKFIPSNLWAYFRPNGVDLSTTFPFVSMPRSIPWVWGDAFYDATYRTASVTATNPLLTFVSVAGVVMFVKLFRQESFWRLLPAVVAGILAAGGVAGWGYIATRYLTDFLPGMLLLSAIGIAGFVRYVHGRTKPFPVGLKRTAQVGGIALVRVVDRREPRDRIQLQLQRRRLGSRSRPLLGGAGCSCAGHRPVAGGPHDRRRLTRVRSSESDRTRNPCDHR